MKKVLVIMLMILCGFAFAGGGAVLLSGCSTSQSESGREILSEPSEDENSGNPDNGDKTDGSNGDDDSPDDDVEGDGTTTQQFTLRNYTFTSTIGHSGNTTEGAKGGCFHAYWRASDRNSKNLDDFYDKNYEGDFSNVTQGYSGGEVTEPGGGKGSSYIARISYATYYQSWWWLIDTNKQNRYVEIKPFKDDDYEFFGVCEQGNESSMRTVKPYAEYYFFGNNDTTYAGDYNYLSNNTSYLDQNFNLLGSVVFRKKYQATYNANGGSGAPSTQTFYAGIGYTMSSKVPTKTGYTFTGWTRSGVGGTKYQPGHVFEDSWASSSDSWYANWTANTYGVSYNANGGRISNSPSLDSVTNISGYSFSLNSDGYYESSNNGVNNSYSLCRVNFTANAGTTVTFYVINYAESDYDFGIFSNLNTTLSSSYTADTSNVYRSFKGSSSSSEQTVSYDITSSGTHYIYIKYRKDGSASLYNDSLQFRMYGKSVTYNSTYSTLPTPTKTGYNFIGWYKESGLTNKVTTSSTVSTAQHHTLYAKWEIATYTLTLYYQSRQVTNDTSFTISSSRGTVRNSTVSYPSGSDRGYVDCTYSTSSVGVTISLTNDTSYDYYMRIGGTPTTSTYTKLYTTSSDSYTYYWTPTSSIQINIYIYQRYTITYNANGGSGTLPASDTNKYKIHGTSLTLGTNSLTKTSYTANGWNANAAGTGTHYTSGASYSTNASDTLYADWTAKISTIKVQIKTSTNGSTYSNSVTGGTVTVRYYYDSNNSPVQSSAVSVTSATATTVATNALISKAVTFTPTAKSGYVFAGIRYSTGTPSSTPPNVTGTPSKTFTPSSTGATYTINVFFKVLSSNQLKYYDEYNSTIEHVSGYEFVMNEDGYYESTNKGVNNSYSLCKVTFTIEETKSLTFEIINYAETNYDFGIFSNLDKTLTSSYSADSTNVYKSYKGSSSLSVVSLTYSNISAGEHFIYIKFRKDSSASSYNDSLQFRIVNTPNSYWYFEHGEYPQSYVGTTMNNTIETAHINQVTTPAGNITYNDGATNQIIEVYSYNSKRYARLQATSTQTLKMSDGTNYTFTKGNWYWFEVEPIRWRVSDYGVSSTSYPTGWSIYGTYKTNFTVVSDRILTLGAVEPSKVSEGWGFSSSDMYSNISGLNEAASTTNFSASITNKQSSTNYTYYKFGNAGQQDKVISVSVLEDGVRVASIEEIDDYLTDYSAKASDMVCFLLGCGTDDKVNYWTRNLGTGLGNGQIITKAGITKSSWLDNVQGVRLALTMGNGSRI